MCVCFCICVCVFASCCQGQPRPRSLVSFDLTDVFCFNAQIVCSYFVLIACRNVLRLSLRYDVHWCCVANGGSRASSGVLSRSLRGCVGGGVGAMVVVVVCRLLLPRVGGRRPRGLPHRRLLPAQCHRPHAVREQHAGLCATLRGGGQQCQRLLYAGGCTLPSCRYAPYP